MSIVKTFDVFCDGTEADGRPCPQWCQDASTTAGAGAARRNARLNGWRNRGGLDLCPAHA